MSAGADEQEIMQPGKRHRVEQQRPVVRFRVFQAVRAQGFGQRIDQIIEESAPNGLGQRSSLPSAMPGLAATGSMRSAMKRGSGDCASSVPKRLRRSGCGDCRSRRW